MKTHGKALLGAAVLAASLPVAANRPLTTETADIVPAGDVQFETFGARTRVAGQPGDTAWTTQAGIGIGWRTQLNVGATRSRAGGESTTLMALGGKTSLIELNDTRPGLTLAYGLTSVRPPAQSWHRDTGFLTLVGTVPVGADLLLHGNLGRLRSALDDRTATTWALGLEYTTPFAIDLIAEAYGERHGRPMRSFGARWQASERFSLNTSYGSQRDTPRLRQWTLGLELDF